MKKKRKIQHSVFVDSLDDEEEARSETELSMPGTLIKVLQSDSPPTSLQLKMGGKLPSLPILLGMRGTRIQGVLNWARNVYGLELPWKRYVEELCSLGGRAVGRTMSDTQGKPWSKPEDQAGFYLDECAAEAMSSLARDLRNPKLSYVSFLRSTLEMSTTRGSSGRNICMDQWYMMLFFRAWYMLPRVFGKGSRFDSRVFVKGKFLRLPYIWLDLRPGPKGTVPSVHILESTIHNRDYRIVRVSLIPFEISRSSMANADLPVYRGVEREMKFCPEVITAKMTFSEDEKDKVVRGDAALVCTLMEMNLARDGDGVNQITSNDTVRVRADFQVDLRIAWDTEKGKLASISADHARPDLMYYVLISIDGTVEGCYMMHLDVFRGPGEATGLDLYYRHPISIAMPISHGKKAPKRGGSNLVVDTTTTSVQLTPPFGEDLDLTPSPRPLRTKIAGQESEERAAWVTSI